MKKIFLILVLVLLVGCSSLGYETSYETDRRLCKKCINECGHIDGDIAFNFIRGCEDNCFENKTEININTRNEYCIIYCQDKWNNRSDVKEYQKCYYAKCDWIC